LENGICFHRVGATKWRSGHSTMRTVNLDYNGTFSDEIQTIALHSSLHASYRPPQRKILQSNQDVGGGFISLLFIGYVRLYVSVFELEYYGLPGRAPGNTMEYRGWSSRALKAGRYRLASRVGRDSMVALLYTGELAHPGIPLT
jgi:hypothetical protein